MDQCVLGIELFFVNVIGVSDFTIAKLGAIVLLDNVARLCEEQRVWCYYYKG